MTLFEIRAREMVTANVMMFPKKTSLLLALWMICTLHISALAEEPAWPQGWTAPHPAHRIIGPHLLKSGRVLTWHYSLAIGA